MKCLFTLSLNDVFEWKKFLILVQPNLVLVNIYFSFLFSFLSSFSSCFFLSFSFFFPIVWLSCCLFKKSLPIQKSWSHSPKLSSRNVIFFSFTFWVQSAWNWFSCKSQVSRFSFYSYGQSFAQVRLWKDHPFLTGLFLWFHFPLDFLGSYLFYYCSFNV